ncbi:MAG TPA: hypothetical protein VKS01_01385 [Bryobacteraceae bacterium]|nr:hypothetical protein [Bryobacteraceae bacterium]
MAFCSNCGTQAEGKFCPKCGSPLAADAGASPAGGTYAAPPPAAPAQAAGMTENVASALCYLLGILTGILFLVLEPYNKNRTIRFHAFQSIFFGLAWIALYIACMILAVVLVFIPVIGHIILLLMYPIIGFGGLVLWLVLMFKAYSNSPLVLPIIGPLAQKQAG